MSQSIFTNLISRHRVSARPEPVRGSKYGTSETCAGTRAGGHNGGNAYKRATKISACDWLSRLMIFLPYSSDVRHQRSDISFIASDVDA